VDGPEFDGHHVNYDVLLQRNTIYREAECRSMEAFRRQQAAHAEPSAEKAEERRLIPQSGGS
jgi:hypothetical protein